MIKRLLQPVRPACRILLASVLLASAVAHIANPYYFLASIYQYNLVGPYAGLTLAIVLPFIQMAIAVCLLIRFWIRAALVSSVVLLGVFGVAQLLVLLKGMTIDCGCFGPFSGVAGARSLLIVAGLLSGAVLVLLGDTQCPLLSRSDA